MYTDLLIQFGENEKAKEVSFQNLKPYQYFSDVQLIERSIQLKPNEDG